MTSYPSTPRPSRPTPTPTPWDSSPSDQPTNQMGGSDVPSSPRANRQQPIMIQNFELLKPNQLQFRRKSLSTANLYLSQASLQRQGSPAVHSRSSRNNNSNIVQEQATDVSVLDSSRTDIPPKSRQHNPPPKASHTKPHTQGDYVTKNQPIKASHLINTHHNQPAVKTLTPSQSKPKRVTFSAKNTFHRYEPKPEEHFQWANYTRDLDPDGNVWYRQKSFIYPADDDHYVTGSVTSSHQKHVFNISSNGDPRRTFNGRFVDIPIRLLLEKFSFDKDRNNSKKVNDVNNNNSSFSNLQHQVSNTDLHNNVTFHTDNGDIDDKTLQNYVNADCFTSSDPPRPHTVHSSSVYNPLDPGTCPDLDSQSHWSSGHSLVSTDHSPPATDSQTYGHSSGNLTPSRVNLDRHNLGTSAPNDGQEVHGSKTNDRSTAVELDGNMTNQHTGYFQAAGNPNDRVRGSWIQNGNDPSLCLNSTLPHKENRQCSSVQTSANIIASSVNASNGDLEAYEDDDVSSIIANPDDGDGDDDNNKNDFTDHKNGGNYDILSANSDNDDIVSEETRTKGTSRSANDVTSNNPDDVKRVNADDATKRVPCPVPVSSFYDAFQEFANIENSVQSRQPDRSTYTNPHPKNYQSPNQFMNGSPAGETPRTLKRQSHVNGNSLSQYNTNTVSGQTYDRHGCNNNNNNNNNNSNNNNYNNKNIIVSQKIIRLNFLKDADPRLKPAKHKNDVSSQNHLLQEYPYQDDAYPSIDPNSSNMAVTGLPLRSDATHGVHSNHVSGGARPDSQPLPLRPSINLTSHVRPMSRGDINAQFLMGFYSSSGDKKPQCYVTSHDLDNSTSSTNQIISSRDNINNKAKRVTFDRDVTDNGSEAESDPVARSTRGRDMERKMVSSASSSRPSGRGQRAGSRSHSASSSRFFVNGSSLQIRGGGVRSNEAESIMGKEDRLHSAERFLVRNSARTAMNRRLEELVRSRSLSSRMRHTMERAKTDLS